MNYVTLQAVYTVSKGSRTSYAVPNHGPVSRIQDLPLVKSIYVLLFKCNTCFALGFKYVIDDRYIFFTIVQY